MTKYRKFAAATAALLCSAGVQPVLAQDAFQGPYVSIYGGQSMTGDGPTDVLFFDTDGDGDFDDQVNTAAGANAFAPGFCTGTATGAERGCTDDDNEWEYGIRAGIDGRLGGGPLLAGVLVEVGKTQLENATSGFSSTPASYVVTREMDYAVSARGRLGFVAGDAALFYATGGVSYAKIDQTFTTTNAANSFTEVNDDKMRFGIQGGGGVEVAVNQGFSLGLEYLYAVYEDDEYYVEVGPGTAPATNPFLLQNPQGTNLKPSHEKFRSHGLRLTGSLRF